MSGAAIRTTARGIVLDIRLTPRGGKDAIEGGLDLSDGRRVLAARVRAVPEKGAANSALVVLIAAGFGVPKAAVEVVSGQTSRIKTVSVDGDPTRLAARAAELLGG